MRTSTRRSRRRWPSQACAPSPRGTLTERRRRQSGGRRCARRPWRVRSSSEVQAARAASTI
eukprot:10836546-Alexandrium_andersonii.AAC.1